MKHHGWLETGMPRETRRREEKLLAPAWPVPFEQEPPPYHPP